MQEIDNTTSKFSSQKKYFQTEKGRQALQRAKQKYRETHKPQSSYQDCKETIKRYQQSEKGREAMRKASNKYYHKKRLEADLQLIGSIVENLGKNALEKDDNGSINDESENTEF
jgi:DNA-binding PadR family transcriptional regulator